MKYIDPVEQFWDNMLSRQPERIRAAYGSLTAADKENLITHLKNMVSEEGWQEEQRKSAQAALDAIQKLLSGA